MKSDKKTGAWDVSLEISSTCLSPSEASNGFSAVSFEALLQ